MAPLVPPLAALTVGILISPCLDPEPVWLCLPLAVLIAVARPGYVLLAMTLLGSALRSHEPSVPALPAASSPGQPARVAGRLTKAPEWRGLGVYLDVRLESIDGQPTHGRVRLTEFLDDEELRRMFEALDLGTNDRLEILVKLHRPAVYRNPGAFDFRRYLERQGIYWTGTIRNPRLIQVLERGWHGRDRIRNWIQGRLRAPFTGDRDTAGLVAGMVLGQKYEVTANVERQFRAGGLYHLLVVSGFNLAVIAGAAYWLARRVRWKRNTRLIFVCLCTLGYAGLVDGQAPVLRATLMVCLLITARLFDRGYSAINTLAATALIMLICDPTALEDASFLMSFAAVLAVAGIGLPASDWGLGWLREALRDFAVCSRDGNLPVEIAEWRVSRRLWCELHGLPFQAVTLPWKAGLVIGELAIISAAVEMVFVLFMIESFHQVSPVSPLLNIPAGLVAAAVTPLALLLIVLPGPAAFLIGWIIQMLITGLLGVLSAILSIPGATLRVPSIPVWVWIIYGAACSVLISALWKRSRAACLFAGSSVLVLQAVMVLGRFSPVVPEAVTLTFLDVGQGDSTLVEFPDGRKILIDGGGVSTGRFLDLRDQSTFSIGEDVVSPFLFSRGIRRLDAVVLTHAHHDHMDGLADVVENFEVGEFWLGRNPMIPRYRRLIERLQEKQVPIRWVTAGQLIGETEILHPPPAWQVRNTAQNDDSVVLLLKTQHGTALLTGDIERQIPVPDRVDVLKVPHHGSRGVRLRVPSRIRVISVGANNPFGHPHASSLPALRTDQLGAITITMAPGGPFVGSTLTKSCLSCKLASLFGGH